MGFKFKFPRHLFTPLLIADAINSTRKEQSSPPSESRVVAVKIKPLIDYTQTILQSSKSEIKQNITQVSTFKIVAVGDAKLTINGNVSTNLTIDAQATEQSYINDTIINRLSTELPDLVANVTLSGPSRAEDSNLWMSIDTSIRDTLSQTNFASIVQRTFDINKSEIYVRGNLTIDGDVSVTQDMITRVLATNIIDALIDNSNVLTTTVPPQQESSGISPIIPLIIGIVSCISSLLILILTILAIQKK
jgi:hypothetical protein